jgi:serine/threonine-protein kinase HipA
MKSGNEIYVYADWQEINGPKLLGILHSEKLRGKEIFSFEYNDEWLESNFSQLLDPNLQLYKGLHYLNDEKKHNFGLFLDSSPDRWGRILMRRREAALARIEQRPERHLYETDYLLGLFDGSRMGALRFKKDKEGPFLSNNEEMAIPPWTTIKFLENISLRLEDEDIINDRNYYKWLNMLVAPGSSLGGARPKANIIDNNNNLWIAKFPSRNDFTNIGGWEIVTYHLAQNAGIIMSKSQAKRFSTKHHTFLTKRFDRTNNGERIHFASAMTLLGYIDGQNYKDGISYLDIVEFISTRGGNPETDLEQLWRRIVFNICVSNVDDHLRNHGFILTQRGWVLSPAYDINPEENGTGLKLNISESDNSLNLDLAMSVCKYFRLSEKKALNILNEIKSSVRTWEKIAQRYGISKAEQDLKSKAFSQSS